MLAPFVLPGPWRGRALVALAAVAVVAVVAKGWPGQSPSDYAHGVKQNESNQFLYRSFELERIMSPENGPASRRLAHVVERELLTRQPYRSYGVDVHEFFASGSDRVFGDLLGVANPADLAAATREAIRAHPEAFVGGIGRTVWEQVALRPVYAPQPSASESQASANTDETQYVVVNGQHLPKPSEGQPIPSSAIGPALWTPGGPAREVWRSPTDHSFVFTDSRDERRFETFNRDVTRLASRIPTRDASAAGVHRLNQASHAFPPLVVWLVLGIAAVVVRRLRGALVALAPCVAGLIVMIATSLVAPSVAEYTAPVSPAFVLLAAVGFVGLPARRERPAFSQAWRARLETVAPYAGAALGVAAAAWAVKLWFIALYWLVSSR